MFQIPQLTRTATMRILLLLSILLPIISSYHINPIDTSSGLLYIHLGTTRLSNHKFVLLNYFNLTHIKDKIYTATSFYYKTLTLCSMLKKNRVELHCQNQLQYIYTKLETIKDDYATLSQLQTSNKRHKRGLLNGIGDGLKFLFGVPDADDAKFYADSINQLINDKKQTSTLMQQQVKIISSAISNFNHSIVDLNKNTIIMNDNLRKFNDFMSRTSTVEERLSFEVNVTSHILTLVEMTDELSTLVKNYVNSLTLIRHGIISLEILHPRDLLKELEFINNKFSLPMEPTLEHAYAYFQIMTVNAFVSKELFIMSFEIPLVDTVVYDLFKIYALPAPHHNDLRLFSYIEPSKPYILISVTRTVYAMLNGLDKCTEYLPEQWLCKEVSTIKRKDQPTCEMELFYKTTISIPQTCDVKTIYADMEIWHQTLPNQWLFVLSKPTTLTILCEGQLNHEEVLQKIGFLELENGCRAYTDNTMVTPPSSSQIKNITHKIPLTDITNDDCCVKTKENITLEAIKLQPIQLTNVNLDELKFVKHKLDQFDEILQQQLNKPFIIKHTNWFTSVLACIGGLACLIIAYNIAKWLGLLSLLKTYLCCTKGPRDPSSKLKAICYPCINIYNQSHNKRTTTTPTLVQYDADVEMEPLSYEVTGPTPTRISGRRSTKSSDGPSAEPPIRVVQN